MTSARGLRLLKALEYYAANKPKHFDVVNIFKKVKIESISHGHLHGKFTVDSSMCNLGDALHGGYISSVMDAFALVAQVADKDGRMCLTTNIHVDFFKPALKGEQMSVKVSPLNKGKYFVMEACLYNERGDLVAKGLSSFLQSGSHIQQLTKDVLNFDVYED